MLGSPSRCRVQRLWGYPDAGSYPGHFHHPETRCLQQPSRGTMHSLSEPQPRDGSSLATALCPARVKAMGRHWPCARSCLCCLWWCASEAPGAGTGRDVPSPAALAPGTSCYQQRAGAGGMLSFSSRLPAGKNSYGPRVPVYLMYL